jgi:hypothetical protein
MTIDEVIAEIVHLGHLAEPDPECEWAVIECAGGEDCWCQHNDVDDDYVWRHNDVVIWPVPESAEVTSQ